MVDDRPLASAIGGRIREARRKVGLSQQQLAEGRYTKAYISALELGLAKPSMAALNFIAGRLGLAASDLLRDAGQGWSRLEADLRLAAGDWATAADAYRSLLDAGPAELVRAELLTGLAEALCKLNRPDEAIPAAAEATATFGAAGRRGDRARAILWLASAHGQRDNADEAIAILSALLAELRAGLVVAPDFAVRVLVSLAMVETHRGAHRVAIGYLEEARASAAELNDLRRAVFLNTLAASYREAGDFEAAIRTGTQALALLRSAEADLEAAQVENHLALAYLAVGDLAHARSLIEHADRTTRRIHDERLLSSLVDTEAQIALAGGDHASALLLADEAIARSEAIDDRKALLDGLVTRARALLAGSRSDEALESLERAAEIARISAPPARLREVLQAWADVLASLGRHEAAYAVAREALESERARVSGSVPTDELPTPAPSRSRSTAG